MLIRHLLHNAEQPRVRYIGTTVCRELNFPRGFHHPSTMRSLVGAFGNYFTGFCFLYFETSEIGEVLQKFYAAHPKVVGTKESTGGLEGKTKRV